MKNRFSKNQLINQSILRTTSRLSFPKKKILLGEKLALLKLNYQILNFNFKHTHTPQTPPPKKKTICGSHLFGLTKRLPPTGEN